ncbi:unnamed protein product [Candida parapsilosis]
MGTAYDGATPLEVEEDNGSISVVELCTVLAVVELEFLLNGVTFEYGSNLDDSAAGSIG